MLQQTCVTGLVLCGQQVPEHLRMRCGVAVVSFVISASLLGSIARSSAAERPTTATAGSMQIRVVDTAGRGLSDAKIHVSIWTKEDFKNNRGYRCDTEGKITIELPSTLEIVRVWARKQGYAPMFAQLWPQRIEDEPLSSKFTFVLVEGTTMGGIVRNDDGQPIQGVRVEVRYDSGGTDVGTPAPSS